MVVLPQSGLDLKMGAIFDVCTFFHLYADRSFRAAETIYLEPQQLKNHNAQSIDNQIIFLCLFFFFKKICPKNILVPASPVFLLSVLYHKKLVWGFIDRRINQLTEKIINT